MFSHILPELPTFATRSASIERGKTPLRRDVQSANPEGAPATRITSASYAATPQRSCLLEKKKGLTKSNNKTQDDYSSSR